MRNASEAPIYFIHNMTNKMVKKFKNLVLTKDTTFEESIEVDGNITCEGISRFFLKVAGNINAGNINAGDINAGDINAWNIVCESRIKKDVKFKTKTRVFIQNKSKLEKKEWD